MRKMRISFCAALAIVSLDRINFIAIVSSSASVFPFPLACLNRVHFSTVEKTPLPMIPCTRNEGDDVVASTADDDDDNNEAFKEKEMISPMVAR